MKPSRIIVMADTGAMLVSVAHKSTSYTLGVVGMKGCRKHVKSYRSVVQALRSNHSTHASIDNRRVCVSD